MQNGPFCIQLRLYFVCTSVMGGVESPYQFTATTHSGSSFPACHASSCPAALYEKRPHSDLVGSFYAIYCKSACFVACRQRLRKRPRNRHSAALPPCPKPAKMGTNTSNSTLPCQKCHFSGTGFLGLRTLLSTKHSDTQSGGYVADLQRRPTGIRRRAW